MKYCTGIKNENEWTTSKQKNKNSTHFEQKIHRQKDHREITIWFPFIKLSKPDKLTCDIRCKVEVTFGIEGKVAKRDGL